MSESIDQAIIDLQEGVKGKNKENNLECTMVNLGCLLQLEQAIRTVVHEDVPGDFIEAGTWRGGCCILVRLLFKELGVTDRRVWVADSFQGIPRPDPVKYPRDRKSKHHKLKFLTAPIEDVKENFRRFGCLADQVVFVKGWFRDTLPKIKGETFSVVRLDGDIYESTMVSLESLWPQLSPGGCLIVDDFKKGKCKAAVIDYFKGIGVKFKPNFVGKQAAWWIK